MDDGAPLRKRKRFSADQSSSSEDFTNDEQYKVWWRHSGEAEIERIPKVVTTTRWRISQILEDIGGNEITHMVLWGTIPPSLHQIAPKLHSLKIQHLQDYTELNRS